jgi:tetratricopeptide (TPR) repeat protein
MMRANIYSLLLVSALFVGTSTIQAKGGQGIAYYNAGFPQVAKPQLIQEIKEDATSSVEPCFYLGNVYFEEGKVDSASIYFKQGLSVDANSSLNAIGLAMLKIKANAKEAETDIQSALRMKGGSKNVEVLIAASRAYLVNDMIDEANVYYEKAKKLKSKYAPVSVLLGDIYVAKKDVGAACSNYEQAILFDNSCKEAYIKYARAYRKVNPTLAIEMLGKLKAKVPTFLLADREMADIYYAQNDFAKAAELYGNYLQSGNSTVQDLTRYALTLFFNKEYPKSIEIAQNGLKKDPTSPAFNRISLYNNTELKKYDEAMNSADRLFNKSVNAKFTYLDYRYYGQVLRDTKQFDKAIEQYHTALKFDSSRVELYKDLSDMCNEKKDYVGAIQNFNIYLSKIDSTKKTSSLMMDFGKLNYSLGAISDTSKVSKAISTEALNVADSTFARIARMETNYRGNFWRARTNALKDPESTQGLAKPYYELTAKYIEEKNDLARYSSVLVECYRYLAFFYLKTKDYSNSIVYCNKALAIDAKDANTTMIFDLATKANKGKK